MTTENLELIINAKGDSIQFIQKLKLELINLEKISMGLMEKLGKGFNFISKRILENIKSIQILEYVLENMIVKTINKLKDINLVFEFDQTNIEKAIKVMQIFTNTLKTANETGIQTKNALLELTYELNSFNTAWDSTYLKEWKDIGNELIDLNKDLIDSIKKVTVAKNDEKKAFDISDIIDWTTTALGSISSIIDIATSLGVEAKFFTNFGTSITSMAKSVGTNLTEIVFGIQGLFSLMGSWAIVAGVAATILSVIIVNAISDANNSTLEFEQNQMKLQEYLAGTETRLENVRTPFDELADEVFPKLQDSYSELQRMLEKENLHINADGLDGISQNVGNIFTQIRDGIDSETTIMYESLKAFYENSSVLSEEKEAESLAQVLLNGSEKITEVKNHEQSMLDIVANAKREKRDNLYPEEIQELREHMNAMQQVTMEILTPAQAKIYAELEAFKQRKGTLQGAEIDEYLKKSQEAYDMEREKQLIEHGTQLKALDERYEQELKKRDEFGTADMDIINSYSESRQQFISDMQVKELELLEKQVAEETEVLTGSNIEKITEFEKYNTEMENLYNEGVDANFAWTNSNQQARYNDVLDLAKSTGVNSSKLKEFNQFLGKQPAEYKAIYASLNESMSLKDGAKNMGDGVGDYKTVGMNVVLGVKQGVENGQGSVFSSIQVMAFKMLEILKKGLDTHSPSKAMARIAKWIGPGIAQGIDQGSNEAFDSMDNLVEGLVQAAGGLEVELDSINSYANSIDKTFDFVFNEPQYAWESPTLTNDITVTSKLDELKDAYDQYIQLERNIVVENHLKASFDGDELSVKLEEANRRNRFRTGRDF